MAKDYSENEETLPLTQDHDAAPRSSNDDTLASPSSVSTTSLVLEHINGHSDKKPARSDRYHDEDSREPFKRTASFDIEDDPYYPSTKPVDRRARRILWILGVLATVGWVLALVMFVSKGTYKHSSTRPHDPQATSSRGSGKKVTLDQVLSGMWRAQSHGISWIDGPNGEDGLLLEKGGSAGKDYLVVENVRTRNDVSVNADRTTLMKDGSFYVGSKWVYVSRVWPSPDHKKVLVLSDYQSNWRHSFTGLYFIFDVATQSAQALDPALPNDRVQLATWAPDSKSIVFTRHNNMYLRSLASEVVTPITTDGGPEYFYGIPDWVYEEEVFQANSATWWSDDSKYIAFLRTNETQVPTYPVQYFMSRPSGKKPLPGEESYPEVRNIKYPKAGAPNPTVHLQFYDVSKGGVFSIPIADDFPDEDRLITEVVWAGSSEKVLIRETNRESDNLKLVLMDVARQSGSIVRTEDVQALDGGWFEVSEDTTFIPSDPSNGRPHDGYIDTVIHEGYDHLAYFTPLDNPEPILLTSGPWEVVNAPSAIDLIHNYVYFVATKESSIQRHVYKVNLDGSGFQALTDTSEEGYYSVSLSKGAGYALMTYSGPKIPWQKIISTPSTESSYEDLIEDNKALAQLAQQHELPIEIYQTVTIDGFELNLVERRPPHFDPKRKYPVLFWQYQGPMSQSVDKKFTVDFQAFVASNLGYIVVTLDGRGTGFRGRKTRCIIRGNIGEYESHDQIAAAKMWAAKPYVDEERLAIWGWSYGGFMTLKTLEQDAGQTFKYGMAVAPVTDWRFYDSIYTERYMHTPQHNKQGYENTAIHNATALQQNVRFLVMHGVADDNVHMQSSLTLIDKLDVAGVENYDVHFFPDSDHGIYFHNANRIVYDKLTTWLINAFNGEWLKTSEPVPIRKIDGPEKR